MSGTPPRLLWVDGSRGAAGDMLLGALVDLGVGVSRLRGALRALDLPGVTLSARRVERCGLAARKVDVRARGGHPARSFREVRRILRGGRLEAPVLRRSLAVFARLFEAEAHVHGASVERVHLHEAAADDAIVDIVGASLGLAWLGVTRVVVSPLTTGFGSVASAHGDYPVPGPATLRLVEGCPVRGGSLEVERLTPTGAAILTTIADTWGPLPLMRPVAVGHGAGTRDLPDTPNVLRLVLGEPLGGEAEDEDPHVVLLECEIDDAAPQELAYAVERLREAGALDASLTAVLMKKGRPGQRLTVLARPGTEGVLADVVLAETPTLGLRLRRERRIELARRHETVTTRYGRVRLKIATRPGARTAWPEHEDCATLARRHGVPLRAVRDAALAAWRRR